MVACLIPITCKIQKLCQDDAFELSIWLRRPRGKVLLNQTRKLVGGRS